MPPDYDGGGVRLVEITIPAGKRDAVLGVLEGEGIDYVVSEEVSNRNYTAVVSFPLPSTAVETVLDELRAAGLPDDAYTVIIDAETVISRRFDELERRYAEADETGSRIAREELEARARELVPDIGTFLVMAAASVVIATAGVLLDSAAVVVGSMVIAPLIGPAMATSVGTVVQNRDLFVEGVKLQVIGFALAILTAAAFASAVRAVNLVPPGIDVLSIGQVRERLAPDFLSLAIALGSGVAGAYSLSSGVSTPLVGVMIAVALVPPTAVVGVGIAWGLPSVVVGSTVLVLVNFLSINLAALAVLWYQGYRPKSWFLEEAARAATIKRMAALVVAIAVLSAFLGGVTYSSYRSAVAADDIRDEVESVVGSAPYGELTLIDVTIETEGRLFDTAAPLVRRPSRVVVTVGRPPGEAYPALAGDLAAAIGADRGLEIEVRFVDTVTAVRGA